VYLKTFEMYFPNAAFIGYQSGTYVMSRGVAKVRRDLQERAASIFRVNSKPSEKPIGSKQQAHGVRRMR
jgi:hypothetical protein